MNLVEPRLEKVLFSQTTDLGETIIYACFKPLSFRGTAIADTNISFLLKKYFKASSILISFLESLTDMETKDLYLSIGPIGKQTIAVLVLFIRLF